MALIGRDDETFCAWPRGRGAASVKGDPVTPSGWWLLPAAVVGVAISIQIIAWLIS